MLKRESVKSRSRIAKDMGDLDRRIAKQIQALEADVEPELVGRRIAELRAEKEKLAVALADLGGDVEESSNEEIADLLERMPDLSKELRKAPLKLKRQVFEAFDLKVVYDKLEKRIEISATVSEAVAEAFVNAKDLSEEVHRVAAARYVSRSYPRIVESLGVAA